MKSAPRILYLASSWPHGQAFGGQLRTLHVGRALKKIGDVSLIVVGSDEPDEETIRQTANEFQLESTVRVIAAPNRTLVRRCRRALDTRFLNVHGCAAESHDRARLLNRLESFDLVWVGNSRTPNILNQWRWPHSVLDLDDVPSTYQRSVWQNGSSLPEKLKAGAQMLLLKRRERLLKQRFTALAVCSEADRQYLGGGKHIHVIPNGFERPVREPTRNPVQPPRIGFIGLYSYPPNREGMNWFVRECWPLVKRQMPEACLRLVGKDTDGPLKPNAADVDALGFVADPTTEIATWSGMVIPIQFGGGTRIKIADAFSRKCPVVSTRFGALGYEVENTRELLLADEPDQFARACVSLIRNPMKASSMAETAYQRFLDHWTWEAIAPRVWAAAEDCLRRSKNAPQAKPA